MRYGHATTIAIKHLIWLVCIYIHEVKTESLRMNEKKKRNKIVIERSNFHKVF